MYDLEHHTSGVDFALLMNEFMQVVYNIYDHDLFFL